MNIKTRKEYSRYDFGTTRYIAIDRLADFGQIRNGNYTYGVGRKGTYINSLNDYCRSPAHLFGATVRANIKDLLSTAGRIVHKKAKVNIKSINFTACNLVINILADGIQVRFRPTSKGNKALREAFEHLFKEALSRIKAVESYKVTIDEYTKFNGLSDAVYIRVKLSQQYLLSYAPYQEKEEPKMERRISTAYGPSFAGQYKESNNTSVLGNKDLWKINKTNSLEITNPPMKPIEDYHADALQHSIDNIEKLIESERTGIQDVLNRIKNMETQRDKLKAAIKELK